MRISGGGAERHVHIHPVERGLALVAGICLVHRGFRRGGLDGLISIIAGSFLTARGVEGSGSPGALLDLRLRRAGEDEGGNDRQ